MSDWIKMRTGLLTNPKVIRMSRILANDRQFIDWWTRGTDADCETNIYELCDVTVVTRVTVGSLLSVWGSVNDCASKSGFVKGITRHEVDEMAGVPGFGSAMVTVGWLEERENGVVFPNFDEHNTVGKDRSSGAKTGAERTKEWRERQAQKVNSSDEHVTTSRDVTVTSQRDHREEESREEKKDLKPSAPSEKISLGDDGKWSGIPIKLSTSWDEAYPAVNVPAELAKAAAWLIANPKNRKSNYARFLTNWLSRAQDSAKPVRSANGSGNGDRCNPNDARYVN